MSEKITAIVLDITPHNERHNVVTVYSRERGRIVFLSPYGAGKSGKVRQARLLPLAAIECDVRFKNNAELQKLGAFSFHSVWKDIYFNPVKSMIAMFLSEFLNRLLKAAMPDASTWDYLFHSIDMLDRMKDGVADFHIVFLSSLLPFAGIQPDYSTYSPGKVFDMQTGVFVDRIPPHKDYLVGEEAKFAAMLCRLNFINCRALHLNSTLRNSILQGLLHYYSIHFPGTGNLKSPEIIKEIFHS